MGPALAILLLAFIASSVRADPLDDWCKTARLPSSIAICGDAELRTLAIERSRAFVEAEARLSPEQQKALLGDQNDWVRSYTRVCGLPDMPSAVTLAPEVKACMARAGSARIAYLRAYGSYSAPPPLGQASAPFAQTPPASASASASATVASSPTRIGPSFDCSKAYSPLALMICASPALSKVDLRFVQAYQALWQQVGKEGQRQLLREAVDFQNAVLRACRIPETGPVSGSPECVAAEYERQRSIWLSRLTGPASQEASRPIEQHIALQAQLQKLGFLPAAVTIDGVYGDATRSSILAWQGVNRRAQTGFLDDADATALAGTRETEATPATQSPSPGQGVPGVGSALEAAAGAQLPNSACHGSSGSTTSGPTRANARLATTAGGARLVSLPRRERRTCPPRRSSRVMCGTPVRCCRSSTTPSLWRRMTRSSVGGRPTGSKGVPAIQRAGVQASARPRTSQERSVGKSGTGQYAGSDHSCFSANRYV